MRRRVLYIAAGLLVIAAAAVLVFFGAGGGKGGQPSVASIAGRVVRGASASLMALRQEATPGAVGLHVTLPDSLVHPAGGASASTDSSAASLLASAGWRSALIAAAAATRIPGLTAFVTTDAAGNQAPGGSFYLDGSVRSVPGQNPVAGMTRLGRVSAAAVRRQVDDNIAVLRRGLPPGSITGVSVSAIPVDGAGTAGALAVEVRVGDLRRLRPDLGDLLGGLATGLAPGPASTVAGLSIHAVDARGLNAGSWMATVAQQGTTIIDPRIHAPALIVPRMRFVNETGGPVAVASAHAGADDASIVVPSVTGRSDLLDAYLKLRRQGLGMTIPQTFSIGSLCPTSARGQSPAAGARVARGTTVAALRLHCPVASPAGGSGQALVPDFTGKPASALVAWAGRAGLYWQLDRLGPLRRSRRPGLLDNYVVTDQRPAAGALLGRGVDCGDYARRCFRATPLVAHARPVRG